MESAVEQAREIARRCVYRPALLDGVPVEARVRKYFLFYR
jgi:hypothetical protein